MQEDPAPDAGVEISPEEMLRIKNRVRASLVTEFHETNIAMRARRKVGDMATARRLQAHLRRIVTMIHTLDNPMDEEF